MRWPRLAMTIHKILRSLEKAACTSAAQSDLEAHYFMDVLCEQSSSEELPCFCAMFYSPEPGEDEESIVRGWLSEARTLKAQCDGLAKLAITNGKPTTQLHRQYRAELRKLAQRIFDRINET